MGETWLMDETKGTGAPPVRAGVARGVRGTSRGAPLAVRIGDMVVHDTRKWFGDADIRVDALFVYGPPKNDAKSFYLPATFRFSGVRDGDRLPIGETGLLVFRGWPTEFLDVFFTVSRDRKDTDDLTTLMTERLKGAEVQAAVATILGLAMAAPPVAAVTGAIGAAAVIGDFAQKVLRQATGSTVGMYRNSYLEKRDEFGVGRHPRQGAYRVNDLSFAYAIDLDTNLGTS